MKCALRSIAASCIALAGWAGAATPPENVLKAGISEYTTHSSTSGITGVGVPPGADASTSNATTVIVVYERLLTPSLGVEFVLGVPPKITAEGTGSVAFLGDDVLSAHNVSPVLFVNYHFGAPGDTWRPYIGAGVNYTKFVRIESKLATDVQMSSSTGWAAQAGVDLALGPAWGLFASVAVLQVKSDLVATGSTVLQTSIDFRPVVYTIGVSYRF